MSQFKGTKGKLTKIYNGNVCIGIGVPIGKNYFEFTANSVIPDCEGWSDKKVSASLEVMEYDMTLYSHAPEMIEMLIEMKSAMLELMNHQDGWEDDYTKLCELIESATNLK